MSYENLKKELAAAVQKHYRGGTSLNDIRAAIYTVALIAEQYGTIELLKTAKSMEKKTLFL